jgi:hypothetical protein
VSLPISQLCPFVNIYLLDLSRNQIKTLRYAFKLLSCLTSLKRFDLSFNLITSPLIDSDFSDDFAQHIEYLNLKNNQIPSIDTKVFFRSDGTSRFSNLYYLDLSNNLIKSLDLLWPMSLKHPSVKVILSNNKIASLKNQLKVSFNNSVFLDVTGDRVVDVSNNELKHFDDSNLLQYHLHTAQDFEKFLNKLSNYDFTNNHFHCVCPNNKTTGGSSGLYTVYWFKSIASRIFDFSPPIYQLYCEQNFQDNNVFDFDCHFNVLPPPPVPLLQLVTFPSIFKNNSFKYHLKNVTHLHRTNATMFKLVSYPSKMWLLTLLLIPIILLPACLFIFCFGRYFLVCFHHKFGVNLCACFRNDDTTVVGKLYDSLILYSLNDQLLLEEKFMPSFALFNKGYKVIKLPIDTTFLMSKGHQECIRACKRILILITDNFLKNEWKNQILRNCLKEIAKNDPYCNVILIYTDDVPSFKVDQYIDEIIQLTDNDDDNKLTNNKYFRFKQKLKNSIKYNCSLKKLETIEWQNDKFWTKFAYAMPMVKNPNRPTEIIQYSTKFADNIFQQQSSSALIISNLFNLDLNNQASNKKSEEIKNIQKLNESNRILGSTHLLPIVTKFKSTPSSHRICAQVFSTQQHQQQQQAEQQQQAANEIDAEFIEKSDFWTKFESFKESKSLIETKKSVGGILKHESNNKNDSNSDTTNSTPVSSSRNTMTENIIIEKILGPIREKTNISPLTAKQNHKTVNILFDNADILSGEKS